jgi:hypothetical protein
MLLLVAFGALGLAGLTGSTVYRLASVSRSMRRQDRWQRNVQLKPAPARRPRPIAARPEPVQELIQEPIEEPVHDEFEHDHYAPDNYAPEQLQAEHRTPEPDVLQQYAPRRRAEAPRAEPQTSDAGNRRENIEAYLAQLTRQLQADLQAHARAE